jgi:hypothetical protein
MEGKMNVLTIILGEKRYTTARITAFYTREATSIQRDTITIATRAKEVEENGIDVDDTFSILNDLSELSDRKANLICKVFDDKFTSEELEKNLTKDEIDGVVQKIMIGINGVLTKN